MTEKPKHYFGRFGGRLAGVPGWSGGHFFTASKRLQDKIERHPKFLKGDIKVIADDDDRSTDVDLSWEEHVKSLSWAELRDLAKDKGISLYGKKAVDLIEELLKE